MLGADAKPALAMYSALRAPNIQNDVMMAAAKEILNHRGLLAVEAVLSFSNSAMADRNKFAHWHWGVCLELPDTILLMKPDGKRQFDRNIGSVQQRAREGTLLDPPVGMDELFGPFGSALVYSARDLSGALDRMKSAKRAVAQMHKLIAGQESAEREDELWQELLAQPELAAAIQRKLGGGPSKDNES